MTVTDDAFDHESRKVLLLAAQIIILLKIVSMYANLLCAVSVIAVCTQTVIDDLLM